MRDFTDRVAVITGAASGIGRSLAKALAHRGCDVALVDVDPDGLTTVETELREFGRRTSVHVCDVSDRTAMASLPQEVFASHGRIDILVNNAGVTVAGDLESQSVEDLHWIVGINLWGVIYGCKFFLPYLRQSDSAYIINLSSMFGLVGVPGQSSYCATKFAVRGFSEAIAAELAGSPVRVMSVHPGGIRTNIARSARYASPKMQRARDKMVRFFEVKTMSPDGCAERIIRAVRRGDSRLLVTPEAHVIDAVKRLFPRVPEAWLAKGRDLIMNG